ncbi:hypothetical protein ACHAPU_002456 [Fusarium lateritium]
MTKSPETEQVASLVKKAVTSSKRKPDSRVRIAKDDHEGIRMRQDNAISRILPDAKNNPELYRKVVDQIRAANLRATWTRSSLSKDFMSWRRASGDDQNARPDLAFLLTVLAVLDSEDPANLKTNTEINGLGLRLWAAEQLKPQCPVPSAAEQPSSGTLQEAPQVKIEQMESMALSHPQLGDDNSIIRQSIESDPSRIHAAGLKRPSLESSSEPMNKRSKILAGPAFSAAVFEPQPRTIVLRDGSTQTDIIDQTLATASVLEVMEKVESRMESFEGRFQDFVEHSRTLQDHNRILVEALERTREGNHPRPFNAGNQRQFQQQAHEIIPIQSISRQPRAYYMPNGGGSDNNDSIFMF